MRVRDDEETGVSRCFDRRSAKRDTGAGAPVRYGSGDGLVDRPLRDSAASPRGVDAPHVRGLQRAIVTQTRPRMT